VKAKVKNRKEETIGGLSHSGHDSSRVSGESMQIDPLIIGKGDEGFE